MGGAGQLQVLGTYIASYPGRMGEEKSLSPPTQPGY